MPRCSWRPPAAPCSGCWSDRGSASPVSPSTSTTLTCPCGWPFRCSRPTWWAGYCPSLRRNRYSPDRRVRIGNHPCHQQLLPPHWSLQMAAARLCRGRCPPVPGYIAWRWKPPPVPAPAISHSPCWTRPRVTCDRARSPAVAACSPWPARPPPAGATSAAGRWPWRWRCFLSRQRCGGGRLSAIGKPFPTYCALSCSCALSWRC